MRCLYCGHPDSKVVDSRTGEENKVIRRRRECLACHKRFSTYERLEQLPLMVIKSNNTREPFDPAKLREGILRACEKRPISIDTIEKIVAEVEYSLSNYVMEVPTKVIGEMVLEKLEKLDPVSYLRFASVYKNFDAVDDFMHMAQLLRDRVNHKNGKNGNGKKEVQSESKRGGTELGSKEIGSVNDVRENQNA